MKTRRVLGIGCLATMVLLGSGLSFMARGKEEAVPLTPQGETLMAKYAGMLAELKKGIVPTIPVVDEQKKAAFIEAHAAVAAVPPQPNPNGLKMAPPRYAPSHKLYAVAQSNAVVAAAPLLSELDAFLASDASDAKLAKLALLAHATPRGLAVFAQQGADEEALIDELLGDDALIKQIMALGGCYQGKYGQGIQIYKAIQEASENARQGFWQSFALASSMEHPDGCMQKEGMTPAEVNVEVFQSYEKAYAEGKLDEAFGTYSDFNWRFPMHHYSIEDMEWMREMMRNYRPDHIRNPDYKWRYCRIVRTDVPYTSGLTGRRDELAPELNLTRFQQFFLEGGICGPRCFTGKLACSSFGIPVRYATQTGHAAFSHWTPDGWTVVFGAHWTFNRHRDICGLDFLLEERARRAPDNEYMKVLRAEWVGDALGEAKVSKRQYGVGGDFWNALALYKKLAIVEAARIAELELTGAELAQSNVPAESPVSDWTPETGTAPEEVEDTGIELTEEQRQIVLGDDGTIIIPPGAAHSTIDTDKILFMHSIDGDDVQVHYSLAGARPELLKFYVEVPEAGTYELTAEVCTVTLDRELMLRLNRRTLIDIPLPYTRGFWGQTDPVQVELRGGRNSLQFTIKAPNKGLSIKHFTLKPVG